MHEDSDAVVLAIQRLYAGAKQDLDFKTILDRIAVRNDMMLAEAIEADGRQRLAAGRDVDLHRYMGAVPDLSARQDPLDAAIDVTLRYLAGSSRVTPHAVEALICKHPELERPIREAAMLNAAVWSTSGLRANTVPQPPKPLPCEFGTLMPNGERRYQLQRLLGQGGFGQVYLALDRHLSEEGHTAMVAIKILSTADRSPWARERLIEEATKVRRINHPNVVTVIDRGVTEQNEDYIVYEYVDGGDLARLAVGAARKSPRETALLVAKIARGVHAAHSAGVIHCDLKPGNIMMTAAGEPKVADFGIAVRRGDGPHGFQQAASSKNKPTIDAGSYEATIASWAGPVGNVAFISPEQYRGEPDALTVQSDVYALGGILFLMLTGKLPNGATLEEIGQTHDPQQGRKQPPSARAFRRDIDGDLDAICRRAMALHPAERYESAAGLAEDLERWARMEPIQWTKPGWLRITKLWAKRKPALAASVGAIVVLFIAGSSIAIHLAAVANRNALDAERAKAKSDQEQAMRLQRKEMAAKFTNSLRTTIGQYRFATENLTKIWAMEYAFGPKVLGLPDEQKELWKDRIINIRNLVRVAHEEGRGEDLETLLWESSLAFWLVMDKDYRESEPLLASNIAKWANRLPPTDPWLMDLRTMQAGAAVNRLMAEQAGKAEPTELRRLEAALVDACEHIAPDHRGTSMHFLILQAMVDLYSANLLNQPQRQTELTTLLDQLVDHQSNDSGCAPAAP